MANDELQEALRREVERVRDAAVLSTDPAVVARAIAMSDPSVQKAIARRLNEGKTLSAATASYDDFGGVRGVHVLFTSPERRINLELDGFLAAVDFATSSVTEIVDPYDATTGPRMAQPFVLATPSDAPQVVMSGPAAQQDAQRTDRFLAEAGVAVTPRGFGVLSGKTTPIETPTGSGNPPVADDSQADQRFDDPADVVIFL